MGCWGRNKGVAIKSIADGLKDIFGILTGRGNIAANTAESLRTLQRSEAAGDLLFDFHHPDIPFPLVIRTSDSLLKMDIRAAHAWRRLKAACL